MSVLHGRGNSFKISEWVLFSVMFRLDLKSNKSNVDGNTAYVGIHINSMMDLSVIGNGSVLFVFV